MANAVITSNLRGVVGAPTYLNVIAQGNPLLIPESVSNAIWCEILRRYFTFPRFVVAPEYRPLAPNGPRVDLVVLTAAPDNNNPQNIPLNIGAGRYFCFEGKSGGLTDNQFLAMVPQIAGYTTTMVAMPNGRRYGLIAAGEKFMVVAYNGGNTYYQIRWDNNNNTLTESPLPQAVWNLTNPNHVADLNSILNTIVPMIP